MTQPDRHNQHPPPSPAYNPYAYAHPQQQVPVTNSTTVVPNPFPWWAHLIHAAGTLFTCGLWGIAWAIHYGAWPKTKLVHTTHWQNTTYPGNQP